MSAILQTSEGETVLTCDSNEWKGETSYIIDNIGNDRQKNVVILTFENRVYFFLFMPNNTKIPKLV